MDRHAHTRACTHSDLHVRSARVLPTPRGARASWRALFLRVRARAGARLLALLRGMIRKPRLRRPQPQSVQRERHARWVQTGACAALVAYHAGIYISEQRAERSAEMALVSSA